MSTGIFEKQAAIKPSAMRTVAERRFDDADCLRKTGLNSRANGAAYLAGFVIEILLKARLVEKYSVIARIRQHSVKDDQRAVWLLIWRQHDLEGMILQMPELEASLKKKGERDSENYVQVLKKICATWTIQARYSPKTMPMSEAAALLDHVRKLKEVAQMTKNQAKILAKALEKQFGGRAEFEPVNKAGRYRFAITSDRFDKTPHLKRQDAIWEVVDKILSREDSLDVSIILAFAPADLTAVA